MSSGKETHSFNLPPSNHETLGEVWEGITASVFKKRPKLLLKPQNTETIYNKNHLVHIKTIGKDTEYDFGTLELWTHPIIICIYPLISPTS